MDILEQLPGYIGWKDSAFRHLGCNTNLSSIMSLQDPSKIWGLKDEELPGCTEEIYHFHRTNDELALNGETVIVIHRSTTPYDGSLFYSTKKPLYDETKKIFGVIYQCQPYELNNFFSHLQKNTKPISQYLLPSHYKMEIFSNPCQLSTRELESLFCLLHGMSAKQISECLGLSKRTIETYLENIKNKFGCQNKTELLIKSINAGYANHIPERFLHTNKIQS
ncbi:MAG: helix-turn-helix transcriptional regulator [Legionella longbeachae]|nr:helix-turn-helix transcriptional regulator [Legionella longbeachae]